MKNVTVGSRVASFIPEAYNDGKPSYGVVTDVLSNGQVMVKWDSQYKNASLENPSKLCGEVDAQVKWSALEEAFNNVEEKVAAELKKASEFVLSAGQIAKEAGMDLLEMYEATRALERAMEKAGWNTSSWHC